MHESRKFRILLIGASAGGVSAIRWFLSHLSPEFQAPIVIVQHLPPTARLDVGLIYGAGTGRKVIEVEDKMRLERGVAYMACPNYHLLLERDGTIALSQDPPVNHSRPSIDLMFDSGARAYGSLAAGVLLTGANSDGAEGLRAIHRAGGLTLVQDPDDAEATAMPRAALRLFEPDLVAALSGIVAYLNQATGMEMEEEALT